MIRYPLDLTRTPSIYILFTNVFGEIFLFVSTLNSIQTNKPFPLTSYIKSLLFDNIFNPLIN